MRRFAHRTSPDRIGWALAAGTAAVAAGAALVGVGSGADVETVLLGALVAGVAGAGVIVVLGAPLWWLIARGVRHAPWAAGVLGFGLGAGLGMAVAAGAPGGWAEALAMAGVAGFLGGLIGLVMWLVAYRPG